MSIEDRVSLAQNFQIKHTAYRPGIEPWPADPITGTLSYPRDTALWKLKATEMHEARPGVLSTSEIEYAVDLAVEQGLSERLLSRSISKIRKDSSLLAIADELKTIFGRGKPGQTLNDRISIWWSTPYTINGVSVLGAYLPGGKIVIAAAQPTASESLTELATTGEIPKPSQTLLHEKTHALQFALVPSGSIPAEFLEAQAKRTRQTSLVELPHEKLVSDVKSTPAYEHLDRRKFEAAVWAIDRLNALGFNQEQIINLTSGAGKWDDAEGHWIDLDNFIKAAREYRQMGELGLERLVLARDLKAATARHRARHATQAILYGAFQRDINIRRRRGYGETEDNMAFA